MIKRFAALLMIVVLCITAAPAAFAAIDVIGDSPWDDPANQVPDNCTYYAHSNEKDYVVLWATPECVVEDGYMIVPNGTKMVVNYRVSYMEGTPWGKVSVPNGTDEQGVPTFFNGWVLMSEQHDESGAPAFVETEPEEPKPTEPVPSDKPEDQEETPIPERPKQAITVTATYNDAIVYTCIAITAGALALVAYVLIKHKALNKKGE